MVTTVAFDPGKRIGWALFQDGAEIRRGVMSWEELVVAFDNLEYYLGGDLTFMGSVVDEVVVENYRIDPGTPQGGREVSASEVIGAVRMMCEQNGVKFTRQEPKILSVAMLHTGYVQTKAHLPDQDSAYLHGFYYEETQGRAHPVPLD
jgi:hypothetical protein